MRMSDIVSSMDMTVFPIIGLVIFLGVFIVVVVRAVLTSPVDAQHAASIPLDDERAANSGLRR